MEELKYYQLKQELKKSVFQPLYFFYGAEEFLQEECCSEIIKKLVPESDKMFSVDIADGEELTVDKFASLYQGLSFFTSHRVLIIKNTENIMTSVAEEIVLFLNALPENITIIFCSSKQKFSDKKKASDKQKASGKFALIKELQKKAKCVVFWPLFPNIMESWVKEHLRAKGIAIEDPAVRELIVISNEDLRVIKSEIEKLDVFLGERKKITLNDIKMLQGQQKEYSVFDLGEMLYKKDLRKGLLCIQKLLSVRYNDVLALNYLAKIFKNMCFAKLLLAENDMAQEEILAQLHIKAFYNKDFFQNLAKFSDSEITSGIALLTEAERKIKTGQGTSLFIMSELWNKICKGKRSLAKSYS